MVRSWWAPAQYELGQGATRVNHALMLFHHANIFACGIIGLLGDASPSVVAILGGRAALFLWSSVFVLFGALAFIARVRRRVSAELWAIATIGGAFILWSVMVALVALQPDTDRGSLQTSVALGGAALMLFAWTASALAWLRGESPTRSTELDTLEHLKAGLTQVIQARQAEDQESAIGENRRHGGQ